MRGSHPPNDDDNANNDPDSEHKYKYAGRHCEHESTDICAKKLKVWKCTEDGEGDQICRWEYIRDDETGAKLDGLEGGATRWFCANGGTCDDGEIDVFKKCKCKDGWTGPHCEYKELSAVAQTNAPQNCDLQCFNGGTCVFGTKDYGEHSTKNDAQMLDFLEEKHEEGMHCVCPDGFTGLRCSVKAEKCDEKLWCYKGSRCSRDGDGKKYCDCGFASDMAATHYAGISCQHKKTATCDVREGTDDVPFCVNGGQCAEEGMGHLGCKNCDPGFSGPRCEFHETEPKKLYDPRQSGCNVQCQNGGRCVGGAKNYGATYDLGAQPVDHVGMQHCACPEGYGGVDCSAALERCGDTGHVCMHGGQCRPLGQREDMSWDWECDCSQARDGAGREVVGEYCQHPATEYCLTEVGASGGGGEGVFCANEGACLDFVEAGEPHPGCRCKRGWGGPHCEFRREDGESGDGASASASGGSSPRAQSSENGRTKKTAIILSFVVVVVALVVFLAVVATLRVTRSEKTEMDGAAQHKENGVVAERSMENEAQGGQFLYGADAAAGVDSMDSMDSMDLMGESELKDVEII